MGSFPERSEAADYYFTYINQVEGGDICATLETQAIDTLAALHQIDETQAGSSYGPGKWTLREVLGHVNDTERLFVFRALWFARGFDTELPSFDQNVAAVSAGANDRSWASLIEEFRTVRAATLSFFRNLPAAAWARRGIASGNPFTVRALAFIAAGHLAHHMKIVRERYLPSLAGSQPAG